MWDDDPASPRYNQWIDTTTQTPGPGPEPMYNTPAYNYGAVIAYNAARTPGLGSAIFLHVSTGGRPPDAWRSRRASCSSVLRWLDPAAAAADRHGDSWGRDAVTRRARRSRRRRVWIAVGAAVAVLVVVGGVWALTRDSSEPGGRAHGDDSVSARDDALVGRDHRSPVTAPTGERSARDHRAAGAVAVLRTRSA